MKTALSLLLAMALAFPAHPAGIPASFASRGTGGGGAIYSATINPADPNELTLSCDMGHGLFSLDGGSTWFTSDFRNYQVIQTSQVRYCTDSGTGLHRLFTLDSRPATDESSTAKPVMSAIMSGAMTVNGAAWTKITGWPNARLANQIFADPNRVDRVIAIESNAGSTNPSNLWVTTYDSATNGPKFPLAAATFSSGSLPNKTRIGGVFFDGNNILLGTNNGLFISTDGGLNFSPGPALPSGGFISMCGAKQGGQIRLYAIGGPSSANIIFNTNGLSLTSNLVYHMDWSPAGGGSWLLDMTGIDNATTGAGDPGDFPNIIAMAPGDISTVYVCCGRRNVFPDVETVYKKTSVSGAWSVCFTAMTNRTTYDNGNLEPGWLGLNNNPVGPVAGLSENGLGYNTPCSLCVNPTDVNDVILTDNAFIHRTRNGGTDWHQLYTHPQSSTHVVGQKFAHGEDYSTGGLDTTVYWWIDFTTTLMTACGSDMKIMQSADGVKWNFNYDHTKLIDDCYMAQTYMNATYPGFTGTRFISCERTASQYGYGTNTDANVNTVSAQNGVNPGVFYLPPGATTPLLLKDNWQSGTGNGSGTLRGNPMWITVDAPRDRIFVSVANSDPSIGGIWRGEGLHNGAAAVVWTKLAMNVPSPLAARSSAPMSTRPFNIRVLDDHKLLVSYACRLPTSGDWEASSGVFYSTNDGATATDVSVPGMFYYTLDVVPDPSDPLNAWYACVWRTEPTNGSKPSTSLAGGAWRTINRGQSWTQIWSGDSANGIGGSATSITVNPDPQFPHEAYLCTRYSGLYFTSDVTATTVVWQQVTSYPFRAPTRVFYDPNHTERIWITSNGNGLRFAYRPGSYAEWQAKQFGAQAGDTSISGPLADPDGDGLTNLQEYALGTNPLVPNPSPVNTANYGSYQSASLAKNPVAVDIAWSAETSTDLVTWSSTGATVVLNNETAFWARDIIVIGGVPMRFFRLKSTLLP